jgi:hypothetical protein
MHSFVLKIPTAQNYSFQVDTHSYYKNACYSLLPIGLGKLNGCVVAVKGISALIIFVFILAFCLMSNIASATTDIIGGTTYAGSITNPGQIWASPIIASGSGTLQNIGVNISRASGNLALGIYTNSSWRPDSLLGNSTVYAMHSGWNNLTIPQTVAITSGTEYWLVIESDSTGSGGYGTYLTYPYYICAKNGFSGFTWYDPFVADNCGNNALPNMEMTYAPSYTSSSTATLTLSNTSIDQGQSILFAASISNGTAPYSYSYDIYAYNSQTASNELIANQLYVSNSYTSNTWLWTPSNDLYLGNSMFGANVVIVDACSIVTNSVYNSFGYNSALTTPEIFPNRATMRYAGQILNISANETNGTSPYTYNFTIYNSTYNTIIANQLGTSSTFLVTTNDLWITNSPVSAHVAVTDNATTKETANSINTPYITIAPDLNLSNSSALINLLTNYTYWQSIGYNTVNLTALYEQNITINTTTSVAENSLYWNGYVAKSNSGSTNDTVKEVYASWRVQPVTISIGSEKYSAQWVGIGYGSPDLIQIGTESNSGLTPLYPLSNYYGWYELYGSGVGQSPICGNGNVTLTQNGVCIVDTEPVKPGDLIDAYIISRGNYSSDNGVNNNLITEKWLMFISDLTPPDQWVASGVMPYQSNEATADFISEDPQGYNVSYNFTRLEYTKTVITRPYTKYSLSIFGDAFAPYSNITYNGVSIPETLSANIVGNNGIEPLGKLNYNAICIGGPKCKYTIDRITPDNSSFGVTGSNLSISISNSIEDNKVDLTTVSTGDTGSNNLNYQWFTTNGNQWFTSSGAFKLIPVQVGGNNVTTSNLLIAVGAPTTFVVFVVDNGLLPSPYPIAYNYTSINVTTTTCGSNSPANILYCIPITLNSIATLSSGWQFNITLPNDYILYSNYFNSSYRNGEFYYGNGTLIDSYLIGTRPNTYIIKLDNQLNAGEPQNIYFGFAASNTYSIWDCNTIGEAPQISSTYASCDSGANIFNNYQNFSGTVCPPGWSCDNVTVDNGIQIPVGDPSFIISNQTFAPANGLVLDFYTPQLISEGDGRGAGDFLAGFMAGTADTSSGNNFTGIYQNAYPLDQNYYVSSQIGNTLYDNSLPVTGYENFAGFVSIYTTHNNITEASNFQTYNITLNELPQDINLHIGFGGLSQKYSVGLNNYISWVGTRDGPATNNGIIITNPVQFTFGSLLNVS